MDNGIGQALTVLVAGMVTVFFILSLVVLVGNVIVRITNKYWPELEIPKVAIVKNQSANTIAAIVAAVDTVTNGKGKITNIEKA